MAGHNRLWIHVANVTKLYMTRTFAPWGKSSLELSPAGAKVPRMELSLHGAKVPRSESSIIRLKGSITNFFGVRQDVSYDNLQLVLVSTVAKKCTAEIRVSLKPDRKTADKTAKIHDRKDT